MRFIIFSIGLLLASFGLGGLYLTIGVADLQLICAADLCSCCVYGGGYGPGVVISL